ncbi:hypothetical protein QCA50_006879 [Cerrena zonata]|uniref:Queuosine 5'-phosphate N-glycosylase/hydrolase n=1 Tax=Cerrena zonata TaxID=2478898 RepID=A0AAW0GKX3_9APHY
MTIALAERPTNVAHGICGHEQGDYSPPSEDAVNPVVESAEYAIKATDVVVISDSGVKAAAQYIDSKVRSISYNPRTWRTHSLHVCPPEPYSPMDTRTGEFMNWMFLISALNFSFWSEREGFPDRFGIVWRTGWRSDKYHVHTGYWSLVAAINRALEEGIPFTDPTFYASPERCPDHLVEHIFRPAPQCTETIPLLRERIVILRQVGSILTTQFSGSFQNFFDEFQIRHDGRGSSLQLVKMVATTFPSFRDETIYGGRRVFIWKRAQILVAELWAAFYPPSTSMSHPLFPAGAAIHQLTMFADYRVPQILHHLRIISYPPSLIKALRSHKAFPTGCREEISIRAASIVAVERVRKEMVALAEARDSTGDFNEEDVSSVLIDFYLWDLAKKLETEEEHIEGVETAEILPAHRTRSIWY